MKMVIDELNKMRYPRPPLSYEVRTYYHDISRYTRPYLSEQRDGIVSAIREVYLI